jgi:hypothetical protein
LLIENSQRSGKIGQSKTSPKINPKTIPATYASLVDCNRNNLHRDWPRSTAIIVAHLQDMVKMNKEWGTDTVRLGAIK